MLQKLIVPSRITNSVSSFSSIFCDMNLLGSSVYFFLLPLFVLSLGPQFHQVSISKLLVLYNKEFNEVDLLQILLQLVMKVTKLLKTSLDCLKATKVVTKWWANVLQTPLMVRATTSCQAKSMSLWPCRYYSSSKIVTVLSLIHHSPLPSDEKCDVNNIS